MSEEYQLTEEEEKIAEKAFKVFLAGHMQLLGRILTSLPQEQRMRVCRYGVHPRIQAHRDAIMSEYRARS